MSTNKETTKINPQIVDLRKQKAALEKKEQSILKKVKQSSLKEIIKLMKNSGITFDEIMMEFDKPEPEKKPRKPYEKRSSSKK